MRTSTVSVVPAATAVLVVLVAVGGREGKDSLVAVERLHHEERVHPEEVTNRKLILVGGLGRIIHVQIRRDSKVVPRCHR
jgi:hypothetical protein